MDRYIFVGRDRLGDLALQLRPHEMFQDGFDNTTVVSPIPRAEIEAFLFPYALGSRINIVNDQDIIDRYPDIIKIKDKAHHPDCDIRGWLMQQFLKLACLDISDANITVIQDPDCFWLRPWQQLDAQGQPRMLWYDYDEPDDYLDVFHRLTGLEYQRPRAHSLVTEFMMVTRDDWSSLKSIIEQRAGCDWVQAIIDAIQPNAEGATWFSEYELLGNWIIYRRQPEMIYERRLFARDFADIDTITPDTNCVINLAHEILVYPSSRLDDDLRQFEQRFPAYGL